MVILSVSFSCKAELSSCFTVSYTISSKLNDSTINIKKNFIKLKFNTQKQYDGKYRICRD